MGFIGSIFDASKGAGFQAKGADILNPASAANWQQNYGQTQAGIGQQQNFVNALQGLNGVQNQADVYNQMQGLQGQLQQQAQGAGPNPALNQLAQTTGQNVANQAALMASARGAGANTALQARQAGMQGAAAQQQAAGQAATLRAQQQLAAQQALQQQQGLLGNMATNQVGQQQTGLNALNQFSQGAQNLTQEQINAQNNANIAMQSNVNNANAQIAAQNARTQGGLLSSIFGGAQQLLGGPISSLFGGGGGAEGFTMPEMGSSFASGGTGAEALTSSADLTPASLGSQFGQQVTAPTNAIFTPPQTPGAGAYSNMRFGSGTNFAKGGEVKGPKSHIGKHLNMAKGGEVPFKGYNPEKHSKSGGLNDSYRKKYNKEHGSHLKRPVTGHPEPGSEAAGRKKSFCARMKGVKGPTSDGGKLTPKGAALKRWNCHAHGGEIHGDHDEECVHYAHGGEHDMRSGGHVPGKPKVGGSKDSYKNDTVPAMLSPGEIVLPRSVTHSDDPVKNAAKFVEAILAKSRSRKKK